MRQILDETFGRPAELSGRVRRRGRASGCEAQLREITKLMLDRLARRLHAQRIEVAFTEDAVDLLAREGFDPQFGARPLRRTIQRLIENQLSRMVLPARRSRATASSSTSWRATSASRSRRARGRRLRQAPGGEATATEIAPAAGAA